MVDILVIQYILAKLAVLGTIFPKCWPVKKKIPHIMQMNHIFNMYMKKYTICMKFYLFLLLFFNIKKVTVILKVAAFQSFLFKKTFILSVYPSQLKPAGLARGRISEGRFSDDALYFTTQPSGNTEINEMFASSKPWQSAKSALIKEKRKKCERRHEV